MVYLIPCGNLTLRVYERTTDVGGEPQVRYRARVAIGNCKRLWGSRQGSVRGTVATLLPKLELKSDEVDSVWDATQKLIDKKAGYEPQVEGI